MNDDDWFWLLGKIYDSTPEPPPYAVIDSDDEGTLAFTDLGPKRAAALREALCLSSDDPIPIGTEIALTRMHLGPKPRSTKAMVNLGDGRGWVEKDS